VEAKDPVSFHQVSMISFTGKSASAGLAFAWDIIRENKAHMDASDFFHSPLPPRTPLAII
jgi:hypothetical protein